MSAENPERWSRIESLLDEVLDRPADERQAYLDEVCDDDELKAEVLSLLIEIEDTTESDFMAQPILSALVPNPSHSPRSGSSLIGQTVDHYEILEKLGGGGMGVVYRGRDLKLGRPVALKFLPPVFSFDFEAKQRLLREARAASSLDHPNICTIHEISEHDDQLFIVMAHYEGITLRQRLAEGPIPLHETLRIATQITSGLQAAHQRHIIHRDIKPANLIITRSGRVKILDFGLAKMTDASLTKTGKALGTLAYMSPEQTRGEPLDQRSDLWSLGVVLYEMLTGVRPFQGHYEHAVIHAIQQSNPTPLRDTQPGLPQALEPIVTRLLQKDRENRYRTAEDLRYDLDDLHVQLRAGTLRPAESPIRPTSTTRRRLLLGFSLALLAAAALWFFVPPFVAPPTLSSATFGNDILITLTGHGTTSPGAAITFSHSTLDFGSLVLNSALERTTTIHNIGTARLTGRANQGSSFDRNGFVFLDGEGEFSLEPGEQKMLNIRFEPESPGRKQSIIQITGEGLNDEDPIVLELTGNGVSATPGVSLLVEPSLADFEQVPVGETVERSFRLSNTGTEPLNGSATGAADFRQNGFVFLGGEGPFSLDPGQYKTLKIGLAPYSIGRKNGTLDITHEALDGTRSTSVTLIGQGVITPGAALRFSDPVLDFGPVTLHSTLERTTTISNVGTAPLIGSVNRDLTFDYGDFIFLKGEGGFSLEPGEQKTLEIQLSPNSVGVKQSRIQIRHNADRPANPIWIEVSGLGVQGMTDADPAVTPMSFDFKEIAVGDSADHMFTLQNNGPEPLSGSARGGPGFRQNGFVFLEGEGPFSLGPGEQKILNIRLSPGSIGTKRGTLEILNNASDNPIRVTLRGRAGATPGAAIMLSREALDFGQIAVGETVDLTFMIQNQGQALLKGSATRDSGFEHNDFVFLEGEGGFSLGPGEQKILKIRLSPNSAGVKQSKIRVQHNAPMRVNK